MSPIETALTRALPSFDQLVLAQKLHDYALVIPVINEGDRIRRQLERIRKVEPRTDTIVADGGSTDGSVAPDFLCSVGVRGLLTYIGIGGLSAQLRMAYAWCLDQGYRGIVTVDGNGKDGVEAIDRFVEKLEAGYAYVQGSRYRPHGQAINTPLAREIAGRLIHAPLLSLTGRRWYTDTTNGFRGYSARYLLDPRVAPFRDVFDRYSLLFYLTVRAGQLGYQTCEIPVSRRYPTTGKTPTKISGLRSYAVLSKDLIDVVRGSYNPR